MHFSTVIGQISGRDPNKVTIYVVLPCGSTSSGRVRHGESRSRILSSALKLMFREMIFQVTSWHLLRNPAPAPFSKRACDYLRRLKLNLQTIS